MAAPRQTALIAIGLALLTFFVYCYSLSPDLHTIDSGELAAASWILGVAHPTGYPLYTLLSYLFAHVLPGEPIVVLNIFSAVCAVASTVFLYLLVADILKNSLLPVLVAALYAFSPTLWRIAVTNEVYPLSALFCILLVYLLYRLRDTRWLFLFAYLAGLSFTNHMSIFALVVPAALYLVISYRLPAAKIFYSLIFFGLGLSLYYYLTARTLGGAAFAWGNPHDLQRLVWHVTGKQYQVWMFSLTAAEIAANAKQGLSFLLRDFLYLFIVLSFIGGHHLFKTDRKKFFLFCAIFVINFLYTINYAIPDIESYYLPALVALTVFSAYGLGRLKKYIKWFYLAPVALAFPLLNYRSATLRANYFTRDFAASQVEQLPDSCLLISNYWDVISPLIYLQEVKDVRRDVVVIDKELLRRTWYIDFLSRRYPDFRRTVDRLVKDYLKELTKFEYGQPYDPATIQARYLAMLEGFVDAKLHQGVFFSLPYADQDLAQVRPEYQRVPYGLVFAVTPDTALRVFDFARVRIRKPPVINDPRLSFNINIVTAMARNNIQYLSQRRRPDLADAVASWQRANYR